MKYFLFNKPLDYERGYIENCRLKEGELSLSEGAAEGMFFSRILDSGERETIWHRFTQEKQPSFGSAVRLYIYAADERKLDLQGRMRDIEDVAKDPDISSEKKAELFEPWLQGEFVNPEDELLFDIKGRYLWFAVFFAAGQEERPGLKNMAFYFPKETWMKYLPGVYSRHKESAAFLERYLALFQTVYDDMENEIRQDPAYLDPSVAAGSFLEQLSSWLDIGNVSTWKEDRLRRLLKEAPRLFRLRGTRKGIIEITALYTGEKPMVIEEWQTREYREKGEQKEALERLYGKDPNVFTLLVKEEYISSAGDYQALLNLVREEAPAYMEVNIVPLKPYIFLGQYSYLGINSRLGQYRPLKLDGMSALQLTVIGNGSEEGDRQ